MVFDESLNTNLDDLISKIDPANLPLSKNCTPVYPHMFVKTNTIFEVAHEAGLATGWSDKHPAYDIVNGPSGAGVDDLFTPEINSLTPAGDGKDYTQTVEWTMYYDR
jgi:hypothetical protein